jgi:hypothetical protein
MKVEHDGDGKLYYIDSNKQLHWIVEVHTYEGDIVRDAINLLLKQVNGVEQNASTCNLQNVVGSALKDDERVHYEALQDCCKGILKVVDSGKVPQRGIMGLRLLLPK